MVRSNSPTAVLAKRDAIVMWWETEWCGFCGVGPGLRGCWCEVETLSRRPFCCRALTEPLSLAPKRALLAGAGNASRKRLPEVPVSTWVPWPRT